MTDTSKVLSEMSEDEWKVLAEKLMPLLRRFARDITALKLYPELVSQSRGDFTRAADEAVVAAEAIMRRLEQ